MKILIAPGAFKGSLSATAAADSIARGLQRSNIKADLHLFPIADGGNGTLDALLMNGGKRITVPVVDPLGRSIEAAYGLLEDGETAVLEMALASGLELLKREELNPLASTTYGTGMLLKAALEDGARRFIVGMGGSATVDGGAGCLQALGVGLLNNEGNEIHPGGGNLHHLSKISTTNLDPRWKEAEVIIASDVDNLTLGEHGASAVFGPQKGASPADVVTLENNLRHFFSVVHEQLGVDVRSARGGGAAGALSAGLMAFLNGRMESGVDLILEYNRFDEHLRGADLVITGEGQIDEQTIHGKGPIGVARRASQHGVPTVALVGGLNADDALLHEAGIHAVLPIVTHPMTLDHALTHAADLLECAALRLGYLLQVKQ